MVVHTHTSRYAPTDRPVSYTARYSRGTRCVYDQHAPPPWDRTTEQQSRSHLYRVQTVQPPPSTDRCAVCPLSPQACCCCGTSGCLAPMTAPPAGWRLLPYLGRLVPGTAAARLPCRVLCWSTGCRQRFCFCGGIRASRNLLSSLSSRNIFGQLSSAQNFFQNLQI